MTGEAVKESEIMKLVMVMAARIGVHLFRNNSGSAWIGRAVFQPNGTVVIHDPRRIKFGVANPGGSDTIGWRPLVITTEMVGKTIAQFTAVELKTSGGKVSKEQAAFLAIVNQCGGLGISASSVAGALIKLV